MKYLSLSKIRFAYVTANMFSAFQRKKTIEISEEWNHFPADSFIQMRETRRLVLHAKYLEKKGPFVPTGLADDKKRLWKQQRAVSMRCFQFANIFYRFFSSHDGLQLLHVCCKKNNWNWHGIGLGMIYTWELNKYVTFPLIMDSRKWHYYGIVCNRSDKVTNEESDEVKWSFIIFLILKIYEYIINSTSVCVCVCVCIECVEFLFFSFHF